MPLPQLLGAAGDPWSHTNLSSVFARTSLYVSDLPLLSLTRTPFIQNDLIMKSIITTAKTIFPNKFISTGTWMKTWTCLLGGHNSTHCRIQDLGGLALCQGGMGGRLMPRWPTQDCSGRALSSDSRRGRERKRPA